MRQITVHLFLGISLAYLARVNLSLAILPIAKEFSWNIMQRSQLLSAFFWGYVITQVPGGILSNRWGGHVVFSWSAFSWSIASILSPMAATWSFSLFWWIRFVLGVSQGAIFAALHNIVSHESSENEKTRIITITTSGCYVATFVMGVIGPILLQQFGWAFLCYGPGVLTLWWWWRWRKLDIASPTAISSTERVFIPWKKLLRHPSILSIILVHFAFQFGYWLILAYLPTYLESLGFDVTHGGEDAIFTSLPWVLMAFAANFGGWLADKWIQAGQASFVVRKRMTWIGVGCAAVSLWVSPGSTPTQSVVLILIALCGGSFTLSGYVMLPMELVPDYAGFVFGVVNAIGTLSAVIALPLAGFCLSMWESWSVVWKMVGSIQVIGLIVFLKWISSDPVLENRKIDV